jgi:transcription-repair coupling factor (superfamily II helicase)
LTREARHRLRAIEEFSDLGSGFNIAMRDLDIRGAGNLLGAEQSGFIDEIGFETYHRILDEAVSELRNEEFADLFGDAERPIPTSESTVELGLDALIPASYVGSANLRLDLYRRIAEADSEESVSDILVEMEDRFGPVPSEVHNLASAASIRIAAQHLRLPRVEFKRNRLFLSIPEKKDELFYDNIFEELLEQMSQLDNRFVIKEMRTKTKLIIQDVPDLDTAVSIMQILRN